MGKRRKTRQEKIIAQLRRKLEVTKKAKWEVGGEKSFDSELRTAELLEPEVRNEKAEAKTSYFPPPNQASNISLPTSYIKKDLIKTAALAALAISLEVVLFFLLG